jgi:hypothetical protein
MARPKRQAVERFESILSITCISKSSKNTQSAVFTSFGTINTLICGLVASPYSSYEPPIIVRYNHSTIVLSL